MELERHVHQIIQEIYTDLAACCEEMGEPLDAESLADSVGDRMHDDHPEYRDIPWETRRAMVLKICKQYV